MTEEEQALAALDFDAVLECYLPGHAAGVQGCEPTEPGTHLVEDRHRIAAHPGGPFRFVVCRAAMIRYRANMHGLVTCAAHEGVMTVHERLRFLGPVADLPAEDRP